MITEVLIPIGKIADIQDVTVLKLRGHRLHENLRFPGEIIIFIVYRYSNNDRLPVSYDGASVFTKWWELD